MVWNNSLLVATLVIALVAAAPASTSPSARSSTHELRHVGRSQPIDENWLINYRHLVESKYNLASGPSRRQVANSISLVNFNKDYIYYTSLAVGTPPVEYNVILDTGSSDLWLVAAACRAGCPAIAKTYSSVGSTTFNATGSQPFGIAYFGGSVNGTTAREAMSMNGVAVSSQPFGQVTNFAGGALPTTATGLMGLAWGRLAQIGTPFWENSATSAPGWDQPLFAFALSRQSNNPAANGEAPGGSFTIGAVNPALYTGDIDWVSIPNGYESWWLIPMSAISVGGTVVELGSQLAAIDTGTTLIGGPPDAVAKLYSGIPGVQQGTGDSSGYYYFPCTASVTASLSFGTRSWPMNPADFAYPTNQPGLCVGAVFALQSAAAGPISPQWIVGDAFLKNVYSVFRYSPSAVGFAALANPNILAVNTSFPLGPNIPVVPGPSTLGPGGGFMTATNGGVYGTLTRGNPAQATASSASRVGALWWQTYILLALSVLSLSSLIP